MKKTLKEVAKNHANKIWNCSISEEKTLHTNCEKSFIAGAKWQAERMYSEKQMDDAYDKGFKDAIERSYSEKEVKHLIHLACFHSGVTVFRRFEKWFENFKKK